jgi:phosphoadenosine phosphosulfate reductase
MLGQMNMNGMDKIQTAIMRLETFEPADGYYLAFSGGKDSVVIKALADMAGVKYDAHYNVTSVDPPELVQFIKQIHPDVECRRPLDENGNQITMWNLIPRKLIPPTRIMRYCCAELKEKGGMGRFCVTGVRADESAKRRKTRAGLELSRTKHYDPDTPPQGMTHICPKGKGRTYLNPIIDWSNADVWEFIRRHKLHVCKLYDEGYKRLGCIGCPMNNHAAAELERYPKYRAAYIRAFDRMIGKRILRDNKQPIARVDHGVKESSWKTGEDVMAWWIRGRKC